MLLSTMNWKRGMLRLWAFAAVLWVGAAIAARAGWQPMRLFSCPF